MRMVANKATNIITKFHKKNTTSSAVAGQGNYTILSSQVIAKFFYGPSCMLSKIDSVLGGSNRCLPRVSPV